jgi:Fe-S-cluster containining protein
MLDQIELQYGLGTVPAPTREKIDARARSQVAMMQVAFPRLARSAYVDEWDDADLDDLVTRFNDMPCPALDSDGSCLVYGYRPLTCRMMGLPVEINGLVQGACDIQTSVPLIQITHALRQEEEQLIGEEAMLLAEQNQGGCSGEEILLPYGFVPASVA